MGESIYDEEDILAAIRRHVWAARSMRMKSALSFNGRGMCRFEWSLKDSVGSVAVLKGTRLLRSCV